MNAEDAQPTTKQLGIPMPTPTIKPLITALGIALMFVGLIAGTSLPLMLAGAVITVGGLYAWLLTPLEPEH